MEPQSESGLTGGMGVDRSRPFRVGTLTALAGLVLVLLGSQDAAALNIPDPPGEPPFLYDQAQLLGPEARTKLRDIQTLTRRQHDTEIAIITIGSLADHSDHDIPFRALARQWLSHWRVGREDGAPGRGMVFLISKHDNYAWVEADRAWGEAWSDHLQAIMDVLVLPRFERDEFDAGALAGTRALLAMARLGPDGEPPRNVGTFSQRMHLRPLMTTPLTQAGIIGFSVLGAALLGAALLLRGLRRHFVLAGTASIVLAWLLWPVLALAALWLLRPQGPAWAGHVLGAGDSSVSGSSGGAGGGGGGGGGGGAGGGGSF